jgi:anti-sigma regulatory factor (Ser/Thr protein kinase)
MNEAAQRSDRIVLVDLQFRRGELHTIRAAAAAFALRHGAADGQIDKLVLMASELVVNAISHGGGFGRVQLWRLGSHLYCEVNDAGRGMPNPDEAGLATPRAGIPGGRGLWVVRSLADTVHICSGPRGTTVTICLSLQP